MYRAYKAEMDKAQGSPRVELTPDTGLVGTVVTARDREDVPVYAFKGIPYAQPPVGELRFQPPRPAQLWKGDRQATEYGPICIQDRGMMEGMLMKIVVPENMSEDCLFLNVWTPTLDQGAKKPVMFYIHGGGFMGGWSDAFEGNALCSYEDVVYVSINYRCGIFGFLSTGDDVAPGNNGLKDQIEALRWVQKYIHKFGGDPDNVTIFGESAGGVSVSLLMLSDEAVGLFHKAISQSGTARLPGFVWSMEYGREKLLAFVEKLGLTSDNSEEILAFLKEKTADELMANITMMDLFIPVTDEVVLRRDCVIKMTNEKTAHIPYMVGCCNHEGALIGSLFGNFDMPNMEVCNETNQMLCAATFNPKTFDLEGYITAVNKEYFDGVEEQEIIKQFVEMHGDANFVYCTLQAADAHCSNNGTYVYYFTIRPSASTYPEWIQADHGFDESFTQGLALYDHNVFTNWPMNEEETELSKKIIKYWANFAKTGDPNGPGLPEWPRYETSDKAYIDLNLDITQGKQLKAEKMTFWRDVMNKYGADII